MQWIRNDSSIKLKFHTEHLNDVFEFRSHTNPYSFSSHKTRIAFRCINPSAFLCMCARCIVMHFNASIHLSDGKTHRKIENTFFGCLNWNPFWLLFITDSLFLFILVDSFSFSECFERSPDALVEHNRILSLLYILSSVVRSFSSFKERSSSVIIICAFDLSSIPFNYRYASIHSLHFLLSTVDAHTHTTDEKMKRNLGRAMAHIHNFWPHPFHRVLHILCCA